MEPRDLAGKDHWDARDASVRARLPSRLNASVADLIDLLDERIKPGDRVLEVGCAPGKFLLWCAVAKQAKVYGVEYAEKSYFNTVKLFADAGAHADIRHEDFLRTSLENETFDVVYSFGVIEHFDDPRPMVRKHVDMLKPGGTAVITVPNYRDGYGWTLKRLNKKNYDLHNISIMSESALIDLSPPGMTTCAYSYGRISPWILSWDRFPRPISFLINYGLNAIALIQPFTPKSLHPWLVLRITKPK